MGASERRTDFPLVPASRNRRLSLGWATATCNPSSSTRIGMARFSRAIASGTRASASGSGVSRRRSVTGMPKKSANASTRPRSSRAPMSMSTSPSRFPEPACCFRAVATWVSVTRPRATSTSPRSPRGRAGGAPWSRAVTGASFTGSDLRDSPDPVGPPSSASSRTRRSPSGTGVLFLCRSFMMISLTSRRRHVCSCAITAHLSSVEFPQHLSNWGTVQRAGGALSRAHVAAGSGHGQRRPPERLKLTPDATLSLEPDTVRDCSRGSREMSPTESGNSVAHPPTKAVKGTRRDQRGVRLDEELSHGTYQVQRHL